MLPCQLTFFYKPPLLIFTTIFCSQEDPLSEVYAATFDGYWCGFS